MLFGCKDHPVGNQHEVPLAKPFRRALILDWETHPNASSSCGLIGYMVSVSDAKQDFCLAHNDKTPISAAAEPLQLQFSSEAIRG
jgi:hypothetical protein